MILAVLLLALAIMVFNSYDLTKFRAEHINCWIAYALFHCCLIGTLSEMYSPNKWIFSKAVFITLLLCSIVATLASVALMLFYIHQRNKYSIHQPQFSSKQETSFCSATNLINQGASSSSSSLASSPINFVTGKKCGWTIGIFWHLLYP